VSPEHASIAKQVIDVDKELQPQAVKRELSIDGNKLIAYVFCLFFHHWRFAGCVYELIFLIFNRRFDTLTVRLVRLTVNAFLENVELVVRTLASFVEDAENPPAPLLE